MTTDNGVTDTEVDLAFQNFKTANGAIQDALDMAIGASNGRLLTEPLSVLDDVIDRLDKARFELEKTCPVEKRKSQTVTELAGAIAQFKAEKPFATGHPTFDRLANGGFRRRQLFIVGASTGVGKTRTLLAVALGLARSGHTVLFVSLELPAVFMASIIGQDPGKLFLVDTLRTVGDIADEVERVRQETGDQDVLVVVDYLQKLHNDAQNEERRIAINAEQLYELAKTLEVPVISAAQLNRIGIRAGEEPDLTCLKGSGGIEQNADVVVLMWRKTEDSNLLYLKTAKNRWGEMLTATLKVDYVALTFEELDEQEVYEEELQAAVEEYILNNGPKTRQEICRGITIHGSHPKVFKLCSVVAKSPLLEMEGLIVKQRESSVIPTDYVPTTPEELQQAKVGAARVAEERAAGLDFGS